MEIETLTNSPWNTIGYVQPQTRKGAATSLVEELVRESQRRQFGGILKAITIPGARQFYRDVCFVETDASGEMILTVEAAEEFLSRQNELRRRYRESSN